MPRACSVCTNTRKSEIERDLLGNDALLRIAKKWRVAESSLRRHRDNHLAPAMLRALAKRDDLSARQLLDWLTGMADQAGMALARTYADRDWQNYRAIHRELRETLLLVARMQGYVEGPTVNVDARKQTAVLAGLSTEELRAMVRAAEDGRLDVVDGEARALAPVSEPAARPVVERPGEGVHNPVLGSGS
jgi:hypothetical protein